MTCAARTLPVSTGLVHSTCGIAISFLPVFPRLSLSLSLLSEGGRRDAGSVVTDAAAVASTGAQRRKREDLEVELRSQKMLLLLPPLASSPDARGKQDEGSKKERGFALAPELSC